MNNADLLQEIAVAMMGSGQNLADDIATSRGGCFENCDGWPAPLMDEQKAILLASADLMNADEINDEQGNAIIARAKKLGEAGGVVNALCRQICPGAYMMFTEDEDFEDETGDPIIKPCLVRSQLAKALIDYSQSQTK